MSNNKSTVQEIRERFDRDVERFSNLETGQSATMDAPLVLDLITSAAAATNPAATNVLDVGCGAGNYTLKLLQRLPNLRPTLIDLSQPMLTRAAARIAAVTSAPIQTIAGDIREIDLPPQSHDIILAAAVLHHLRTDAEWLAVFRKFHRTLSPGGSLWISDFICHDNPAVQSIMWDRFGDYLKNLKDAAYRDAVFAYVQKEDTPRSVTFQTRLLAEVGFAPIDILHQNTCFAALGAIKPPSPNP